MAPDWEVLSSGWRLHLSELFSETHTNLFIATPYITSHGANFLLQSLPKDNGGSLELSILTDLSPQNVCKGATEPEALQTIAKRIPKLRLAHLPKLHAKVYVSDQRSAIVTSANLTKGGLLLNYECGVRINDPKLALAVHKDIEAYAGLGARISGESLAEYCALSGEARKAYEERETGISKSVQRQLERCLVQASDQLIRLRLEGGAMHTVFARTILYLLEREGPLITQDIHTRVRMIHPDLCDDSVDRIIDGKSFGKKWKHAVRSAQQRLKKQGDVGLSNGRWSLRK